MGALQNVFTVIVPEIGPIMQESLRNKGGLFPFVNTDFGRTAQQFGDTINATFASAISAQTITASPSGTALAAVTPTQKTLVLDQWYEAGFNTTHKQDQEIANRPAWFAEQIVECIEGMYTQMDSSFTSASIAAAKNGGTYSYGYSGSMAAGIMSSSYDYFAHANRIFMDNKAPSTGRNMILTPVVAEGYRLNTALHKVNEAGDTL